MNAPASTVRLNDGQRAALDLSRDMLVSAGAGAGKTQVLGLRYLALLEEGLAAVPEIVAFTFTEKAAAEMRERVQKLLLERISELPRGERLERLKRAQAEFAANRITTVHGFCHRVLRDYAWEAGLEPGAPILDPRDQSLARENAVKRVLLRTDADDQPALTAALVRLGSVVRLLSLTGTLLGMLADRAAVSAPLHRAAELWADPDAEVSRRRARYESLLGEHLETVFAAVNAINFAAAAGINPNNKLCIQLKDLRQAVEARDGHALRDCLLTKAGDPRAPVGAKGDWKRDPAAFEEIRGQVQEAARALLPIVDVLDFRFDEAFERRVGGVARDLAVVFDAVCAAYVEECAGALDFLDLELKTLELLRDNPDARAEIIRGARYLLVDEYQDTNPTQDELFQLLTTRQDVPGRFFAVGDSKQSIYAFRGSDVRVFNRALEWIPARNTASGAAERPQQLPWELGAQLPDAKDAKKSKSRQVVVSDERQSGIVRLEHNYRTIEPVLNLGNAVFRDIFQRDDFRDFDARPQDMRFGSSPGSPADDAGNPPVEFHALDAASAAEEAEYVAQQVLELRDWNVPLSDIAILVRRGTRNFAYRAAFARHGLPLLVIGEGGLFETQEALDCINLLRALSSENDDIAVLGLLRSPFAGLSDRFLTELSLQGNRNALLQRLREWPAKPPEADTFLQRFATLQSRAGRDAPALLLTEALSAFGYPLAVGCGPDAEQRLANVARVVELIREMQHGLPSLAPLVRELRERIERGEDEAQGAPEGITDGVRLMTIHKSKGLEFPVVILPDLAASISGGSTGMVRDLPEEPGEPLGLHLKSLDDDDRGDSRGCFEAWRAKLANRERAAAEEKRVLYVAYTRAEQRLICVASLKADKPFDKETWAHQLLRALGVHAWEQTSPHAALALNWMDEVEMAEPVPHSAAIQAALDALKAGELPLELDDSLVGGIAAVTTAMGAPEARAPIGDPDAMEFGTLVHAGIERSIRSALSQAGPAGAARTRAEAAPSKPAFDVDVHVRRARESLAKLPKAREIPEFGLMTREGMRRLDLLRILGPNRYQIIDYKTDIFDGDAHAHAETEHGEQLRGYANALRDYLQARGQVSAEIGMFVCFTAPESLQPEQRLVEITPG